MFGSERKIKKCILSAISQSSETDEEDSSESGSFLLVIFILYVIIGALICPLWEKWDFFDAVYFCFVTLTTIGFGDLYPKNLVFLAPTLIYITVGLALTTMSIEVAGTIFKKLHYIGIKLKNARNTKIWFGSKPLKVIELAVAIGRKCGASDEFVRNIDFDTLVEDAVAEREGQLPEEPLQHVVVEAQPLLNLLTHIPKEDKDDSSYGDDYEEILQNGEVLELSATFVEDTKSMNESPRRGAKVEQADITIVGDMEGVVAFHDVVVTSAAILCAKSDLTIHVPTELESPDVSSDLASEIAPDESMNNVSIATEITEALERIADFEKITVTQPELLVDQVSIKVESPVSPAPPQEPIQKPQVPETYKKSFSATLGLKLPTMSERKSMKEPKSDPPLFAHPFVLAKISDIQKANFPLKRCKSCHVTFPVIRKGQRERGPRNVALIHWERDEP